MIEWILINFIDIFHLTHRTLVTWLCVLHIYWYICLYTCIYISMYVYATYYLCAFVPLDGLTHINNSTTYKHTIAATKTKTKKTIATKHTKQ